MRLSAGPLTTIGEAMIVLYPDGARTLTDAVMFRSDVGGAEFNVATSLARLGVPTAWVSRLGADGLGDRILSTAVDAGVDTTAVERDAARATGLYLREPIAQASGGGTRMHYYRRDSAAAALSPDSLDDAAAASVLRRSALVHTSGITAALSPSAAAAVGGLRARVDEQTLVSVDLNYRAQLWAGVDTARLDALIAQADLLLCGRDEAEAYFGHAEPQRLFEQAPALRAVVVKDDGHRASVHHRDGAVVHVPGLTVDVVEPVGAGDAFAAGFLCGLVESRSDEAALRLGHALAALALVGEGDRPLTVPDRAERDTIAAVSDDIWSGWRVGPGALPWRSLS